MTVRMPMAAVMLGWCLVYPAAARGAQQPAATTSTLTPAEPQTDLMDLWRKLRKKPPQPAAEANRATSFVVVPVIGNKPTTGFRYGVGATIEFLLGDPVTTHRSSFNAAVVGSSKKQFGLFGVPTLYGADDRWQFTGDDHFAQTLVPNAAVGSGTLPASGDDIDYTSLRFFNTFSWEVANHLYAGAGLYFERQSDIKAADDSTSDVASSPFVTYSNANGFDLATQTASGVGLAGTFDSRDYPDDATRGWYGAATYRFYIDGFLGGDSSWQLLSLDARTYKRIKNDIRHRLAFWGFADLVTSGTGTYLSLPMIGGDPKGRSGRGYSVGDFRGERWLYGEAEYRFTLTSNGLVGMVAFVNATTVSNTQTDQKLFDSVEPAAGTGLRLMLFKRSRTNVCFDFGWGRDGAFGFYLALADAF